MDKLKPLNGNVKKLMEFIDGMFEKAECIAPYLMLAVGVCGLLISVLVLYNILNDKEASLTLAVMMLIIGIACIVGGICGFLLWRGPLSIKQTKDERMQDKT